MTNANPEWLTKDCLLCGEPLDLTLEDWHLRHATSGGNHDDCERCEAAMADSP